MIQINKQLLILQQNTKDLVTCTCDLNYRTYVLVTLYHTFDLVSHMYDLIYLLYMTLYLVHTTKTFFISIDNIQTVRNCISLNQMMLYSVALKMMLTSLSIGDMLISFKIALTF